MVGWEEAAPCKDSKLKWRIPRSVGGMTNFGSIIHRFDMRSAALNSRSVIILLMRLLENTKIVAFPLAHHLNGGLGRGCPLQRFNISYDEKFIFREPE
jgi:hypothetical protein